MTSSQGLLDPGFLFSQHSLNTYVQCPRRFLLRYVDRQPWPMLERDEPLAYEEHLARGRVFHPANFFADGVAFRFFGFHFQDQSAALFVLRQNLVHNRLVHVPFAQRFANYFRVFTY